MASKRVLVIGTTADYIATIAQRYPGRALFLTDAQERQSSRYPAPDSTSEVLCNLTSAEAALRRLDSHLAQYDLSPEGVIAYDCESLLLAARVADRHGLPFASQRAVENCRSKFLSKQLWQQAGVTCPGSRTVATISEAVSFMQEIGGSAIMKPLTGSGSELVFVCHDKLACVASFKMITAGLSERRATRMYRDQYGVVSNNGDAVPFIIEEFIQGREYSCDIILADGTVEIVRIAKKIAATDQPVGTTLAYVVPSALPGAIDREAFKKQVIKAAQAVGLTRAFCMLDFIVRDDQVYLLELTPRPGGDCLPPLIERSLGIDMFGLSLDFAASKTVSVPDSSPRQPLVGLRIIARRAGVLQGIDTNAIETGPGVLDVYQKHPPGHRVVLPPTDYDSRILGHVIFRPASRRALEGQCRAIEEKLKIRLEPVSCPIPAA